MNIIATKVSPETISFDEYNSYWISLKCDIQLLLDYLGEPHIHRENTPVPRDHWLYEFECGLVCVFTKESERFYINSDEADSVH